MPLQPPPPTLPPLAGVCGGEGVQGLAGADGLSEAWRSVLGRNDALRPTAAEGSIVGLTARSDALRPGRLPLPRSSHETSAVVVAERRPSGNDTPTPTVGLSADGVSLESTLPMCSLVGLLPGAPLPSRSPVGLLEGRLILAPAPALPLLGPMPSAGPVAVLDGALAGAIGMKLAGLNNRELSLLVL